MFFNSLGDHCLEIHDALNKIGASVSAQLLEKAMTWFSESKPSSDREERWKQLEPYEDNNEYADALDELDQKFYEYEDNLAGLLHDYVRNNPEANIKA